MKRLLAYALFLAALQSQNDLRDVIRLVKGTEIQGRVIDPHAATELLVAQGGKRIRVLRTDILELQLVGDSVREFLDRRLALRDNVRGNWILCEWAQSHGLDNLARLQAIDMALRDDDAKAHAWLGHKQKKGEWLWPHANQRVPLRELDGLLTKEPITLLGERFALRCNGDLRANVAALFDLERLGVWLHATLGKDLQLRESLKPVLTVTWRNAADFPKWGFRPSPYYLPDPHGDEARTFFLLATRPHLLFFTGAHALLYHCMIGSVDAHDDRDRVCAWLEIGLSMLAENSLGGEAGFAVPQPSKTLDLSALQALGRDYRITHLLHLPMYGGFYQLDNSETAVAWHSAAMFTQFLLDKTNAPATREPFFAFARKALLERQGDSSSVFDATMGQRVEALEPPFVAWLHRLYGG
ncbi:hypothetical protein LBMAG49_22830 [Planctomycetota bacterium]|nr:hypothetical protein LBMAG49_22830 [Planctomycetota bacterium]